MLLDFLHKQFYFSLTYLLGVCALKVDESLAQPLTWSRKEALPSGVWDLELLDDSDDSGNDDEDDIDSSARREYALVYAPW